LSETWVLFSFTYIKFLYFPGFRSIPRRENISAGIKQIWSCHSINWH